MKRQFGNIALWQWAVTIILALGCVSAASAQTWPSRPVTLIYPFSAGGGGDMTARLLAAELGKAWNQTVIVENRPGGSGMLGYAAMKGGRPDGYLMSFIHNGLTVVRRIADPEFTGDVGRDYEAVDVVFENPIQFASHPSAPFKSAKEFVSYVRANPGKVNISMGGIGSADHIVLEMFKQQSGLDFVIVNYNGAAKQVQGTLAGEAHAIWTSIALQQYVDSGQLVPLGVSVASKPTYLKDWPTLSEVGFANLYPFITWVGLFAPPKTPREIIQKVNQSLRVIYSEPEVRRRALTAGVLVGATPEETASRIRNEIQQVGPAVKKLGLKFGT